MIFDTQLNWKSHIKSLSVACHKRLNLLKYLSNQHWGTDERTLLLVYRTLIRSKIDYGCIAYASANSSVLKYIDTIHNSALRLILGAFRTTPVESLYCEIGEPSLHYRRQFLSLTYASRIAALRTTPTYNNTMTTRFLGAYNNKRTTPPFYERVRRLLPTIQLQKLPPLYSSQFNNPPPWTVNLPPINTYLSRFDKNNTNKQLIIQHFYDILDRYHSYLKLYTDASKTHAGVGAAVVTDTDTSKYKLPETASVLTGELYAILQALSYARRSTAEKSIVITDSLSSLQLLKKIYVTHPIARLIKSELYKLQSLNKKVILLWVPSHIGIPGNETADRNAGEATNNPFLQPATKTLSADLKVHFKQKVRGLWNAQWQNKDSKLKEVKPNVGPWHSAGQNRRQQIMLTRLRLGHTNLTQKHLITREDEPMCDMCQVNITVKHILVQCPKFRSQRIRFKIPLTLYDILGYECNVNNPMLFLNSLEISNKL